MKFIFGSQKTEPIYMSECAFRTLLHILNACHSFRLGKCFSLRVQLGCFIVIVICHSMRYVLYCYLFIQLS